MTLDEIEKWARDTAGRRINDTPAEMFGLARVVLATLPAIRAGLKWSADEELHTDDANCVAGYHDDCPSRTSKPKAQDAFDALRAALEVES